MQMLKKCKFILDNLRDEDLIEVQHLWGPSWKEKILETITNQDVIFAYGQDYFGDNVPIAMGGFCKLEDGKYRIACVWLLSTKYISINSISFMKQIKEHFFANEWKYDILYNYIYKSNKKAKRWLYKLGFSFDNPRPLQLNLKQDFEFFYKLRKGK